VAVQSLLLPAQLPADPTLADRLEDSLRGLVRAACAQQRANPLLARLLSPIIGRLNRIAARLHIIVAQFHAGTLPAPSATPRRHLPNTPPPADDAPPGDPQPGNGPTCDAQPGNGPAGHGPPARRIQALPSARAWLVKLMGWPAPCYGSHLNTMLAEPEMLALVQAAPQAGRLLRPLCRMFGIDPLPEYLRLPPRPPRRRASRRQASRTPPDNSARRTSGRRGRCPLHLRRGRRHRRIYRPADTAQPRSACGGTTRCGAVRRRFSQSQTRDASPRARITRAGARVTGAAARALEPFGLRFEVDLIAGAFARPFRYALTKVIAGRRHCGGALRHTASASISTS
jgi:hypothetical protein